MPDKFLKGFAQTFNPEQIVAPLVQQAAEDRRWQKLEEQRKLDQQDKLDLETYKQGLENAKQVAETNNAKQYLDYATKINEYYNSDIPESPDPQEIERQKQLFSPEVTAEMQQKYLGLSPSVATRMNELIDKQTGGSWRIFPELETAVKVLENGSIIYSDKIKGLREAQERENVKVVEEDAGDGKVNLVEVNLSTGNKRVIAPISKPKTTSTTKEKVNPLSTPEGLEGFNINRQQEIEGLRKNIDNFKMMKGDEITDPTTLGMLAKYSDPVRLKFREIANMTRQHATPDQLKKINSMDKILKDVYKFNLDDVAKNDPKKRKEVYRNLVQKMEDAYPTEDYDPVDANEAMLLKTYLRTRLQIIYE